MHVYTVTQYNKQTQSLKTFVFKHSDRDVAMCRAHSHFSLLEEMSDWGNNHCELNIIYKHHEEVFA